MWMHAGKFALGAATPTNMPTPTHPTAGPVGTVTSMPLSLQTGPRRPRGIYTVVYVNGEIETQQKANPSITPTDLHQYFNNLYSSLLENPAVSGLALQVGWNILNPNPPTSSNPYDWSYLDDAFSSVSQWNNQHPTQAPKTIQVLVFAGFFTPAWVLAQIPTCDGLFQSPSQTPAKDCGKATFMGYFEPVDDLSTLPLPWNPFYKQSFETFLTAFAMQYGSNPAFVSIAVAGPTAASVEILLPNNNNTPAQAQFGGIAPNDMWLRLLAFAYPDKPRVQKSDQAFIDEWKAAIDMYGKIFSGVTLVVTTGDGLPNFSNTGFTVPSAFKSDCPVPDMDCAAETTILAYFVSAAVGGANAKATQESGMTGRTPVASNLNVAATKWLSQSTSLNPAPSSQILGGEQFATSATRAPVQEGCTSKFPPDKSKSTGNSNPAAVPVADIPQACLAPGITPADLTGYQQFGDLPAKDLIPPEQGLYNVLKNYFDGTAAAASFGGTPGTAPMNYLQIYAPDIQFATAHVSAPVMVVETNGPSAQMTAQDLLNLASGKLLGIAEPAPSH
jgi:hypothetical protein